MELFKVIIIDDEILIAENLAELVDYSEYLLEIVGCFDNAESAIEYIASNRVDAIITDVKMKDMSGIDLLKFIHDTYPEIYVILFSAHRKFEYAKQAVSYNAFEYLTKPICFEEYTGTLKKLRNSLQKTKNNDISFKEKEAATSGVDKIICDYLNDVTDDEVFFRDMKRKGVTRDIIESYCALCELKVENMDEYLDNVWIHGQERLLYAIRQILPYSSDGCVLYAIPEERDTLQFVVLTLSKDDKERKVERLIEQLKKEVQAILSAKISIDIKGTGNSLVMLKHGIKKSVAYLTNTIISCVINNSLEEAERVGKKIFDTCSLEEQQECCILMSRFIQKYSGAEEFVPLEDVNIVIISNTYTLNMYFSEMLDVLSNTRKRDELPEKIILDVIRYINKHYAENITLSSVAAYSMMNYSYFSSFFKRYVGDTFSNFLSKVRMEKASELIRRNPNMKIQAICEEVGYKSLPYFYKEFRSYIGCSPAEYRNK